MSQISNLQANTQDNQLAQQDEARASKRAMRLIFAGVAMMALAGGVMWWRFGPSMFMSLLTAAANCF